MRGVGVLQLKCFRSNIQVRGHIKQRNHALNTLGCANVAFQNKLIGIRIHTKLNIIRQITLQLISHILGFCVFNLEHFNAHSAILGQRGYINLWTQHGNGLQFADFGEQVNHDDLVSFNHADSI